MDEQSNVQNACQKCGQTSDQLQNSNKRLVVEICGHTKCRDCFIREENGCEECNNSKLPSTSENAHYNKQLSIEEDLGIIFKLLHLINFERLIKFNNSLQTMIEHLLKIHQKRIKRQCLRKS